VRPEGREQDGGTTRAGPGEASKRIGGETRQQDGGETRKQEQRGNPQPRTAKRENRDEVRYGTPGARDKAKAAGNRDK
jgi:hypothetical protein